MSKSNNFWKELPAWAKGAIAVAVVGGVAVIGITVYRKINKGVKKSKEDKPFTNTISNIDTEIKDSTKQGLKQSFPLSTYSSNANQIYNLLEGAETPLSEYKAAELVAKTVNNKLDWQLLVKYFGTKEVPDAFSFGMAKTKYNLPDLLKDQLDSRILTPSYFTIGKFSKKYWGTDTWATALSDYLQTKGVSF